MIPALVVPLVLVTSTIALPLTTQEHPVAGINETPQFQSGIPLTIVSQQTEKTGVQPSETSPFTEQGTQTKVDQIEKSSVQFEQFTGLNAVQGQQAEKTGLQSLSDVQNNPEFTKYSQQNFPAPNVENVPVSVEQPQTFYTQSPVLLPVQPLSVVPVNPTGQILRPVVVPAEAIADGRVIIASIGSGQQRNFLQDVTSEKQAVTHQQVTQPVTHTAAQTQGVEPNQQSYYVQAVEKQTSLPQEIQPTGQDYTSVQFYTNQESFNRGQQISTLKAVQQGAESVQNYYQTPVEQTFSQTRQPENVEKQSTYLTAIGQVPAQSVESNLQQKQVYNVQQTPEKQGLHQQNYYPQNQVYGGKPIVVENVEKQGPYQQPKEFQTQNGETIYQQQQVYNPQQAAEKQANDQVSGYSPNKIHQAEQNVVQKTEKQGQYEQIYTQPQHQVESLQPAVEKQTSYQESVQAVPNVPVQTHPVQFVHQQLHSVQSEQRENQVPYNQASQQLNVENVPEQEVKTSEVEKNQQDIKAQPQQVANYAAEPVYNYGDKLPQVQQHVPVHSLSAVPHPQENPVQSVVSSTHE